MAKRLYRENYLEIIDSWIESAEKDPDQLCLVWLTDKYSDKPIISIEQFGPKLLGLSKQQSKTLLEHAPDRVERILKLMESRNLVSEDVRASQQNMINRMGLLLRRLEAEPALLAKIAVSNHGSKGVQVRRLISGFPEYEFTLLINRQKGAPATEYFRGVFSPRVIELMRENGIINQAKTPEKDDEKTRPKETHTSRFLAAKKRLDVSTMAEFEAHCSQPFDQTLNLLALGSRAYSSKSTVSNYQQCVRHLRDFFESQGFGGTETLHEMLSDFFPVHFRGYLEDLVASKQMAPKTASTLVSVLQLSLERLSDLKGSEEFNFVKVSGFDIRGRATDTYRPYSKAQREAISEILEEEIDRVWNFHTSPYQKAESGQTFVKTIEGGYRINGELCTETNLKWFFDQELKSGRIGYREAKEAGVDSSEHIFFKAARQFLQRNIHLSPKIEDLYDRWGVWRNVYVDEVFPFYLRLMQVTGLNPDSALELTVDSFVRSHPATQKPCLRYWKERSLGSKEMHLDIFDADITWLSKSQAKTVADLIDKVKYLTSSLREVLEDDDPLKDLIFIGISTGQKTFGKISRIYNNSYGHMSGDLRDKYFYKLTDKQTGEIVDLVATRFRSSLVSEMVEAGVSVREIQLMLGHGSIQTTLNYLDRMDFNKQARERIQEKLKQLYDESWVEKKRIKSSIVKADESNIIYKTPLGGCANIFNPPDFIKNSPSYKGGACSNFNKCLACENVIITLSHLPDLFALFRDYKEAWANGKIAKTPHAPVIRGNIDILESILGNGSEFSKEELNEAERLSRYVESTVVLDGVSL